MDRVRKTFIRASVGGLLGAVLMAASFEFSVEKLVDKEETVSSLMESEGLSEMEARETFNRYMRELVDAGWLAFGGYGAGLGVLMGLVLSLGDRKEEEGSHILRIPRARLSPDPSPV